MTEPTADITTTKPDPVVEAAPMSPAAIEPADITVAHAADPVTSPLIKAEAAPVDVAPADITAERPATATPDATRTQPSFTDLLARLRADTVVVPYRRSLLAGAALLVATAVGFGGGRLTGRHHVASTERADAAETTASLRQTHDDVAHLGAELKALRVAVDGMKATRGELATKQAQLVDRTEKLGAETATRIGKIGEQLERIEKTQRDPARVAALVERLDRIEKQGQPAPLTVATATPPAAAPTPPPKPIVASSDIMQTGSLPDAKPATKATEFDPRKTALEGYVLRDLDEGDYALVENRQGRLFEVRPGSNLPGIGRIEAIERRGRRWVVITPKGYIAER